MGLWKNRSLIPTFRSRENKRNSIVCHGPNRLLDLAKKQGRFVFCENKVLVVVWKGDDGQSFGIGHSEQKALLEKDLEDEGTQQNKNIPLAGVLWSATNKSQSFQAKGCGCSNLLAVWQWAWDHVACIMVLPKQPYSLGIEVWVGEEGLPTVDNFLGLGCSS